MAGRLLRVDVEPGDQVERGETVVGRMLPMNPTMLDVRTREEARTAVATAEAAVRLSRAELNKAIADRELADKELERARRLLEVNTASQEEVDRIVRSARSAIASLDTAKAAISMREAELANARTRLIGFNDPDPGTAVGAEVEGEVPIHAPATGRVLRVIQQSETILPAGAAVLEIGNIENDLEVVVELLSTDAVKVAPGDRVLIEDWGGTEALDAVVERVDPWGFTKFSALGVEEQRVNAVIRFAGTRERQGSLGHGYRVEARIVVWRDDDALIVPSSALFRDGDAWAAFVEQDGLASLRKVEIGHDNGVEAEVLGGLEPGERVILYPSSGLSAGMKVERRQVE